MKKKSAAKSSTARRPAEKVARRKIKRKTPSGWWGRGRSPHLRWPGVTIEIGDCGGKYFYDKAAADRAVEFFASELKHTKGEFDGQPFILQPWEDLLIIRPIFGWKHAKDTVIKVGGKTIEIPAGTRRFRKVFVEVPKKSGKSHLGAGCGVYLLECDGEPGAEIGSAASDREQAKIIFDLARAFVEDNDLMAEQTEVLTKVLYVPKTRSSYKVLSADVKSKHGPNWSGLIMDELHTLPNRQLYDTLTKGTAGRRQPLILEFTTAGEDEEGTICGEEYQYAKNVLSGVYDDETFLPVVFELSEKDRENWTDPKVWAKVNPGLGISPKLEYLQAECAAAVNDPRKQPAFKRLHLDIWQKEYAAAIPLEWWDACDGRVVENELSDLACAGGLDLSSETDLCAFSAVFRKPDPPGAAPTVIALPLEGADDAVHDDQEETEDLNINFTLDILTWFWMPDSTLWERSTKDNIPYTLWRDQGFIFETGGNMTDYNAIYRFIKGSVSARFPNLKEIGFDPWNAGAVVQALEGAGFDMVKVIQGPKTLSTAFKVLTAMIKDGRVRHLVRNGARHLVQNGSGKAEWVANPVMRRCIDVVAARKDANGNIAPTKPQDDRKRIDGVSAAVTALSRLLAQPAVPAAPAMIEVW